MMHAASTHDTLKFIKGHFLTFFSHGCRRMQVCVVAACLLFFVLPMGPNTKGVNLAPPSMYVRRRPMHGSGLAVCERGIKAIVYLSMTGRAEKTENHV